MRRFGRKRTRKYWGIGSVGFEGSRLLTEMSSCEKHFIIYTPYNNPYNEEEKKCYTNSDMS